MNIEIKYFAMLKECSGKSIEQLDIEPMSVSAIFDLLNQKYKFPLTSKEVRFAINDTFVENDTLVKENDKIVFIPPVAGG